MPGMCEKLSKESTVKFNLKGKSTLIGTPSVLI